MSAKTNNTEVRTPEKKTVTVHLDRKKGQPGVEVIIGGYKCTVPRGRDVEVPRGVAQVLKNVEEYANKALDYEEKNHEDGN